MLIYNGKELTKYKDKTGGKNKDPIDGFYRDSDGNEFFIKNPADSRELFTELFAGLLLEEFKRRDLIPKRYHSSFICSNYIRLEDGCYALIQPKVSFKELFHVIGTGNKEGSDRHSLTEVLFGPDYYVRLTEIESHFGLSMILMISLLFGDYSVHSGNVVCLNSTTKAIQFGRIDLGAAFRNFGYKANNSNILYPLEYQGWFNHTGLTKGYFLNYKKIIGLFPAIAQKAKTLEQKLSTPLLEDTINTVLAKIPADLIDESVKNRLSSYLGISSFSEISLGKEQNSSSFCRDFIEILELRLKKITELHDLVPADYGKLYRSKSKENLIAHQKLALLTNNKLSFPQQMETWQALLAGSRSACLTADKIHLGELVAEFNHFLNTLIDHVASTQAKIDESTLSSQNCQEDIVCSCPEALYLRKFFTLNRDGIPTFSENTLEGLPNPHDPPWSTVHTLLTAGFNILVTLRITQETQSLSDPDNTHDFALCNLFSNLVVHLAEFQQAYQALKSHYNLADHAPQIMPKSSNATSSLSEINPFREEANKNRLAQTKSGKYRFFNLASSQEGVELDTFNCPKEENNLDVKEDITTNQTV
ncbi:hypothetical protein [Legionella hackeliae]|uniref:Putative effector protein B n=1 Tax=Legionella hackeliae TaxID=449 RepID=A0A0A8USH8_LEGHA